MKYLLCLFLIIGLGCGFLNAAAKEKVAESDITAMNAYNEIIYIPKAWGTLKSVTSHGNFDLLYFESSTGDIYTVAAYVSSDGRVAFSTEAADFNNFISDPDMITGSKILRK
ncbi:MAG: hypothetical protein ABIH89_05245 [Elusimicrobiota bacterium]